MNIFCKIGMFVCCLFIHESAFAADWYWRTPETEDGCNNVSYSCDGKSYETAWRLPNIEQFREGRVDFTQMNTGDTLFVCGKHGEFWSDLQLLVNKAGIIVSGACPNDPANFAGQKAPRIKVEADHVTIRDITINHQSIFPNSVEGIIIRNADFVTIDNVRLGYMTVGIKCEYQSICHNLTVKNSLIEHTSSGIALYYSGGNSDSWNLTNNIIRHGETVWDWSNDHEAISIQGGTGHQFIGNTICDFEYGIAVFASPQRVLKDLVIEDNVIFDLRDGSQAETWPSRGIQRIHEGESTAYSDNHIIRNNFVADVDSFGIRWKCPIGATCSVEGNRLVKTQGLDLIGAVASINNQIFPYDYPAGTSKLDCDAVSSVLGEADTIPPAPPQNPRVEILSNP